jgi:hypothetical protein
MIARRVAAVLLCLTPAVGRAQQPQVAVTPEAITVGDVFHAAVRLETPGTATVIAPESPALGPDLEMAGVREIRIDTVAGARRTTVLYPLTAWRPGSYDLDELILRVVEDDGEREIRVQLPAFVVRSVLPADTAGIEPQPAKDVLGANRLWWPILLGLMVAALVAAALVAWWRGRARPAPSVVVLPEIAPRDAALAHLEELRNSGLLERGELKPFYGRITEILRRYVATLDPAWGTDLTTRELSARLRSAGLPEALALTRILGTADLVKFARASIAADRGRNDLAAACDWVERVPPVPVPAEQDAERRVA